jgi:hypothetical protein
MAVWHEGECSRLAKDQQAKSAAQGAAGDPLQQYHIYYADNSDRKHVSYHSEAVLRAIMARAKIGAIKITSTVRDEREQAEAMLKNIQDGNDVRYAKAGESVKSAANAALKEGKDHDEVIAAMVAQIRKVGLTKVTAHAVKEGLNTIDISPRYLYSQKNGKEVYGRFVKAVKASVGTDLSRFGWPEGPTGGYRLFKDGGALHVEIPQPNINDAVLPSRTMAPA